MIGLTFNNKHSYKQFGLILNYKKISTPSKKKIKDTIPFMNGSYDFSTVGSNGDIIYSQRTIEVKFTILAENKTNLQQKFDIVKQWLLESGKSQLIFDDITDSYFIAEIEDGSNLDEINEVGEFTVIFVCEPFRTGKDFAGQELWDNLNFETDILQSTSFTISGSQTVSIHNGGRNIVPEVIVSTDMSCTLNGYTANFTTTKTKDYKFKFKNGINSIVINGTGNIEFRFRKEVL
jgi:predicted phage tail component-like protein